MYELRLCVVWSGIHWQQLGWRHIGLEPIFAYHKDRFSPKKYDVIVIPKGIHEGFFKKNGKALIDFLEHGGILICFGEMPYPWIPNTCWQKTDSSRKVIFKPEIDQVLMCKASPCEPILFEDWTRAPHGHFRDFPTGSQILSTTDKQSTQVVAFLKNFSGGGHLLATTLDPDYHSYTENKCAQCFLNLLVGWMREKVMQANMEKGKNDSRLITWRDVFRKTFDNKYKLSIEFVIGLLIALLAHRYLF